MYTCTTPASPGDSWSEVRRGEYVFVRYVDVTEPMGENDIVLDCLCLRWAMEGGKGHTLNFIPTSSEVFDIGDCYGLVPFASVRSVYHIVRSYQSVHSVYPQNLGLPTDSTLIGSISTKIKR